MTESNEPADRRDTEETTDRFDTEIVSDRRDHVLESVLGFIEALRQAGARIPANAGIDGIGALVEIGFDDRERGRAALRATLITRKTDIETFERLFPAFWQRLTADPDSQWLGDDDGADVDFSPFGSDAPTPGDDAGDELPAEPPAEPTTDSNDDDDDGSDSVDEIASQLLRMAAVDANGQNDETGEDDEPTETARYSPVGTPEQVEVQPAVIGPNDPVATAVDRLTGALVDRQGRRWHTRDDQHVDPRRAFRRSLGTGGTVLEVPTRGRLPSEVRATLLVDVSRSVLDVIDRGFLLQFLREATASWRSVRIFFFDTDVREVTESFDARSMRTALEALERAETTWGGGTRIGHALAEIRTTYPSAIERDTVVFIISDGLEVGEIDVLEDGMAWLDRRSRAVLWLNPLAASPAYEPACRGMTVSMPYIDGLFPFVGLTDLDEIARQIDRHGLAGPVGYEYDPRRVESV